MGSKGRGGKRMEGEGKGNGGRGGEKGRGRSPRLLRFPPGPRGARIVTDHTVYFLDRIRAPSRCRTGCNGDAPSQWRKVIFATPGGGHGFSSKSGHDVSELFSVISH